MRIGILTHNYPKTSEDRSDAGVFIYDFAQELAKKHRVFVFCPDFSGKKDCYKKVPVTWFDWGGDGGKFGDWSLASPLSVLRFFKLMARGKKAAIEFTKRNRLDFCLATWALPSGVFAQCVKKKLGIPYATWSLGSDLNKYAKFPILRQLIERSLKKADVCFANSYLLLDKVERLSRRRCRFMPAITEFDLKSIKPIKLDKNIFNFLFVGRLEKVKGPDILIEACRSLKRKSPDFVVHILGDGSLLVSLKKQVDRLGIKGNIDFFGLAGKREVGGYMLGADCLVISSRSESLPLVLLEAARAGLAIVATDVGDCRRLIKDYNMGVVVSREDPQRFAGAMLEAMRQGKSFKRKHKEGLSRVAKDFTQKYAVKTFLDEVKEKV